MFGFRRGRVQMVQGRGLLMYGVGTATGVWILHLESASRWFGDGIGA
jgi:hypothetical protein